MIGRITVKRYDYPERTFHLKSGKTRTIPAHSESYYYWNGMEVAHYWSKGDCLGLNSKYLIRAHDRSYLWRMQNSNHSVMWADLCEFLSITEDTHLTEYFNM